MRDMVEENGGIHNTVAMDFLDKGYKDCTPEEKEFIDQQVAQAGSAETGGEKAAPELNMTRADDGRPQFLWFGGKYYTIEHPECMDALLKAIREFPTFPRSSQNQTVSSGVEGAHEGTTADKSESREPEKLNNAQISEWEQEIPRDNRFKGWVEPAESSLSQKCTECGDVRLSTEHGVDGHDFKESTMEDLEMQIRKELYRAASLLGAKSDLLGVIGSWGDTLPDADILQHLKDWNEGESSLSSPPPEKGKL